MESKAALRKIYEDRRAQVMGAHRLADEAQICETLTQNTNILAATHIGVYLAFGNEVNLERFIAWGWETGKKLYLPVMHETHLHFARYEKHTSLKKNGFGFLAPAEGEWITLNKLDTMLVPGLAFDQEGNRLGRGAGHYDRTLAHHHPEKPHCMGIGFACQVIEKLPVDKWDIKMDEVISP